MNNEFTGVVEIITEKKKVGNPSADTQDIVLVEQGAEYPNRICINFYGDKKIKALDGVKVGDIVTASYNLGVNARKKDESSEVRYFQKISGWRVQKAEANTASQDDGEDLPF